MRTFNYVPRAFKLRSVEPELIIQYNYPLWERAGLLLILSPFVALFLAHGVVLLLAMKALLALDFGQFIHTLSYSTDNLLHVLTFVFTFILLGGLSWYGSESALTATELRATNEEILLTYKTLWRYYEVSVPSSSIAYFHQYLKQDAVSGDRWLLEAVTNQRPSWEVESLPTWLLMAAQNSKALDIRIDHKVVSLFSNSGRMPVEWLGKVLADFYRVEQKI